MLKRNKHHPQFLKKGRPPNLCLSSLLLLKLAALYCVQILFRE